MLDTNQGVQKPSYLSILLSGRNFVKIISVKENAERNPDVFTLLVSTQYLLSFVLTDLIRDKQNSYFTGYARAESRESEWQSISVVSFL
jgi:hypothetical protein